MELVTEVEPQLSAEAIADEKKDLIANINFKMVTFSLAGKDYAIDIMRVKEIAKTGRFTYVPNTAHFVLGVYNLRGDIIPIIDLRLFFNIPIPERSSNEIENMIIVSIEEQTFGVVVDAIDKVVGIQKNLIQSPHPIFGDINIKYIYGIVENAGHLYILFDIERIFGSKSQITEEKKEEDIELALVEQAVAAKTVVRAVVSAKQIALEKKEVPITQKQEFTDNKESADYLFIKETLATQENFHVTTINENWIKHRFIEWCDEKAASAQLQNKADREQFLKPFYSSGSGKFWSEELCQAIYKVLPENAAKQLNVWNLGCAKGYETYSLACVLMKRYPESRIRIYAHDIDLISISNAPMLTISPEAVHSWFEPYLVKNVSGAITFNQEIKDMILFEYHDCLNTGNMPSSDIIFTRDVVSFLTPQAQDSIFEQFVDQLKGNGVLILGENETCGVHRGWEEKMTGSVVVYTK